MKRQLSSHSAYSPTLFSQPLFPSRCTGPVQAATRHPPPHTHTLQTSLRCIRPILSSPLGGPNREANRFHCPFLVPILDLIEAIAALMWPHDGTLGPRGGLAGAMGLIRIPKRNLHSMGWRGPRGGAASHLAPVSSRRSPQADSIATRGPVWVVLFLTEHKSSIPVLAPLCHAYHVVRTNDHLNVRSFLLRAGMPAQSIPTLVNLMRSHAEQRADIKELTYSIPVHRSGWSDRTVYRLSLSQP